MYASAMKFCGAMEVCGIGYPTNEPADFHWPAVLKQAEAQNAGLLMAITRGHKPTEAGLMMEKGFAAVYQFTNPRTGTVATVWLLDLTKHGATVVPPQIVVQASVPSALTGREAGAVNWDMPINYSNPLSSLGLGEAESARLRAPNESIDRLSAQIAQPRIYVDPNDGPAYSSGVASAYPSDDQAPF